MSFSAVNTVNAKAFNEKFGQPSVLFIIINFFNTKMVKWRMPFVVRTFYCFLLLVLPELGLEG